VSFSADSVAKQDVGKPEKVRAVPAFAAQLLSASEKVACGQALQ
jgi:hypothetical protein